LAALVRDRYGIPVVVTIFHRNLAVDFGSAVCGTSRLAMAKAEFPNVDKWILAEHSLGGLAAVTDA
jgi:hypothetical protein